MNEPVCPNCKSIITFGIAILRNKVLTKIKCPHCNAILLKIQSNNRDSDIIIGDTK